MNELYGLINRLIDLAVDNQLILARDVVYTRNRLLAFFHEDAYTSTPPASGDLYKTLDALTEIGIQKGLLEDTLSQRDIFSSQLMNIFLPAPSWIERDFWSLYHKAPKKATSYFYNLSRCSNYIKVNRINKNIRFTSPSPYGDLDITINLSKPEKDPKDIAAQRSLSTHKYPVCLLCRENEGYNGTATHPDRSNHRMISLNINNRDWLLQYSPYLYYDQHCILLSARHEPMTLTKNSFSNLLNFVKLFPHYFLGSNADLPIVGGSILAHEHYQGGCYEFPMHRAQILKRFSLKAYPGVTCRLLHWPLSTISLAGDSIDKLVECGNYIYEKWKNYSDPDADILAFTNGERHNTVTPVARKDGSSYILDIVLRNNRTTDEYPLGIFHPHQPEWHIKKENIGLIEVMGLAILPARLKNELAEVKNYISGLTDTVPACHEKWAQQLKAEYDGSDITTYLHQAVGKKFVKVLEAAGVFKTTAEGLKNFDRFIAYLND